MSTQKYKNLFRNPNVAIVAWQENPIKTVQMEGQASVVNEPVEQEKYFKEVFKVAHELVDAPPVAQMMNSEIALIKIVPMSAQLSEFDPQDQSPTFQETNF